MINLHRWKLFCDKGDELNLAKIPKIQVEITDSTGKEAILMPITNSSGDIIFLEIVSSGLGYVAPTILLTDDNGFVTQIPTLDISLDLTDGSFLSVNVINIPLGEWSYPAIKLDGDLYFNEKVPTGLISTQNIFLLEEVKGVNGIVKYTFPRAGEDGKIRWQWKDTDNKYDDESIFMFDVDTTSSLTPFIEKSDIFDYDIPDGTADGFTVGKKFYRVVSNINTNSLQLNLGASYPEEGIFEKTLEFYDYSDSENPYLLGEIFLRAEVIPEDDRFVTILTNLGQQINAEEEFIFRDSNIQEDLPDVNLLNKKRKEFILEHSNITPYIGSYKALFNVLNWLGYDDLGIKEYWLNINTNSINYDKYKPIEVPYQLKGRSRDATSEEFLPSTKYKKTNLFGLYYDINRVSGDVDQFGLPETEDAFMFTNQEVLIKLFALKKYLKEKFLPLNARIIDIVGEGVYFERVAVKTWEDGTEILNVDFSRRAEFIAQPVKPTITDLRKLQDFNYFQAANIRAVRNYSTGSLDFAVLDPGFGYVGDVELEIIGGGAPSVAADVTVNILNGSVSSVTVNNSGLGYTSTPTVKVTPELSDFDQDSTTLNNIASFILAYFYKNTLDNLPDSPDTPIGAPVVLSTTTFDISWDSLQYPWDEFYYDFRPATFQAVIDGSGEVVQIIILDGGQGYLSIPSLVFDGGSPITPAAANVTVVNGSVISVVITDPGSGYSAVPTVSSSGGIPISDLNAWDTIGFGNFYEIEWIIKGVFPVGFEHSIRGRVDDLKDYPVVLPFVGKYSVELILHNTLNYQTNEIKKGYIEVNMPAVEFTGFGRFTECKYLWDEQDQTWNDSNFMWINPVRHETSWDDMELSWDDMAMKSYVNQDEFLPNLQRKEIVRVSETDRFLGNLVNANFATNTIIVNNPVSRPPVESGDFLYFRQDDNIIRKQVVLADYFYQINDIVVGNPGSYVIEYDLDNGLYNVPGDWSTLTPQNRPVGIIDDPINGITATTNIILDGEIVSQQFLTGSGQGYLYKEGGNSIFPTPFAGTYPTDPVYRIIFPNPNPNGITGYRDAVFTSNGSFFDWAGPLFPGSGYNNPPTTFKVLDADGDEVVNNDPGVNPLLPPELIEFQNVAIQGPIIGIQIINPGSGYTSIPNITIYPNVEPPAAPYPGTLNATGEIISLNPNAEVGTFIMNGLPQGLNPSWEVLREIGRTILLPGNQVFNEDTNKQGLKIGQWLSIFGEEDIIKEKEILVTDIITDNLNLVSGITLSGEYYDFIVGEKTRIYKIREFVYGTGANPDEFIVDIVNNQIIIINPSWNPLEEIIPGFHEIELKNIDGNLITYNQRLLVVHIEDVNGDYVLSVEPIDGDISQFNFLSNSCIKYRYWEFPNVIVQSIAGGGSTELILNFNDWPEHEEFTNDPNNINDPWYFDYGIVSGTWSAEVIDIGIEGNNTVVSVDDPNSILWRSSTSYTVGWREFDEELAKRRHGTNIHVWDNMNQLQWKDACSFTWEMLEYNQHKYTGFKITNVQPSGRIQWNEEGVFEFTTVTPGTFSQRMEQAVEELNSTDNSGLSRFYYILIMDSNNDVEYIAAMSKTPGGEALGYVRFLSGALGEYVSDPTLSHTLPLNNSLNSLWTSGFYGPENKPALWDPTLRAYLEWGVDPAGEAGWYPAETLPTVYASSQRQWESERIPYLASICGPFNWSDTKVSCRNMEIPLYGTMVFTPSKSKIPGKSKYLWVVKNSETGEIVVKSKNKFLIWTFAEIGNFDISLRIIDRNFNSNFSEKKGFIKTYIPS